MLVRAINQKLLLEISPNLVCICILTSFQHLLIVSDLDLHLQGHLALKYLKFGNFGAYLHDQSQSHVFHLWSSNVVQIEFI